MGQKLIAAARDARASVSYQKSLAHDRAREERRNRMYDTIDYALGLDTEGARRAADALARAAEMKERTRPKLPTKDERRAAAKKARRQQGQKKDTIVDPDGIIRQVEVRGAPLRSGLDEQQRRAAQDFERDWNAAYRTLRCRGFDPAVDGGGAGSREHLARVEAQGRLRRLEAKLGERDWVILKATVLYGTGPREAHQRGAPQHVIVAHEIKRVLNLVAAFYRPGCLRRDSMLDACASVVAEMERQAG
jgi:hypothetical protein